jgi:hypothetical protein
MQTAELSVGMVINFRTLTRAYRSYVVNALADEQHAGSVELYQLAGYRVGATPKTEWVELSSFLPRTLELVRNR